MVKLTLAVKAHLQPTPSFDKGVVQVGGAAIGYVCIEPFVDKPIIVHRPGDRMDDGAILFRYPAETAAIKFGDLKTLLDDRDARRLNALAEATRKMAAIGIENSAILNVENGALEVAGRPMQIDQSLLDQIKFIREGQFDEVAGAPALKLVGEITSLGGDKMPGGRRLITDEDALRNFLDQETLLEPIEYIRWAVAGTNRDWMPIFYFAHRAGITASELAGFVKEVSTTRTTARARAVERALRTRSAYGKHLGTPAKLLASILDGSCPLPADPKTAGNIALALQGLPTADPQPREHMLGLLSASASILMQQDQGAAMSHVYRAAGRMDEVYFAPMLASAE